MRLARLLVTRWGLRSNGLCEQVVCWKYARSQPVRRRSVLFVVLPVPLFAPCFSRLTPAISRPAEHQATKGGISGFLPRSWLCARAICGSSVARLGCPHLPETLLALKLAWGRGCGDQRSSRLLLLGAPLLSSAASLRRHPAVGSSGALPRCRRWVAKGGTLRQGLGLLCVPPLFLVFVLPWCACSFPACSLRVTRRLLVSFREVYRRSLGLRDCLSSLLLTDC